MVGKEARNISFFAQIDLKQTLFNNRQAGSSHSLARWMLMLLLPLTATIPSSVGEKKSPLEICSFFSFHDLTSTKDTPEQNRPLKHNPIVLPAVFKFGIKKDSPKKSSNASTQFYFLFATVMNHWPTLIIDRTLLFFSLSKDAKTELG